MDKFMSAFWYAVEVQKSEIAIKLADSIPRYF